MPSAFKFKRLESTVLKGGAINIRFASLHCADCSTCINSATSADDQLTIFFFFFFFQKLGIVIFMQIVFYGDNLHEMSKPVS